MRTRHVAAAAGCGASRVRFFVFTAALVSLFALAGSAPAAIGASADSRAPAAIGTRADSHAPARARPHIALPIAFEQNLGQAGEDVRFLARGDGFVLALEERAAVLALQGDAGARRDAVLRFDGANDRATVAGLDVVRAVSHYYIGNDPARWIEGAPQYERVRYTGVYPGIDVVFHARGRELEYDFEIEPGADPNTIGVRIEGADAVTPAPSGDVTIELGGRTLVLRAPHTYQMEHGERHAVASSYRVGGDGVVRFEVADYDRTKTLVVDPVLSYVTYLGGALGERIGDLTVDAGGNVYVTGYTFSADFPVTTGAVRSGTSDLFVARLNSAGNAVIFSTYVGGTSTESDGRIALDGAGNVYFSGLTASTNFPVLNAAQPANAGSLDFTVTKLSPAGTLVYSTYVGGSSVELFADGMAVDSTGAAYICGDTVSQNYPTTNAAWDETCGTTGACNGGFDGVVTKLSPDGSSIVYSTYVGGSENDFTIDVDVDAAGSAYVIGMTTSADLPTTAGAAQPVYNGDSNDPSFDGGDAFLVKLTPAGDTAAYATYIGGSDDDGAFGVAVDGAGSAYVVGATTSTDFPVTTDAFQTTFAGGVGGGSFGVPGQFVGGDGFVAKLTPAGDGYEWATYIGGSANDKMNRIAVRGTSPYVAGEVRSNDMPTVDPVQAAYGGGDFDGYAFRLSSDGSALLSATYIGGGNDTLAAGVEFAAGVAVDHDGNAYVAGGTSANDLPTTTGALQELFGGASNSLGDGWIAKLPMGSNAPGAPPDHYLCYKARGQPRFTALEGVAIEDDVENQHFDVSSRNLLCNPADREHQGIAFGDVHALGYRIRRVSNAAKLVKQTAIPVTDQFGTYLYDTKVESGLLIPSAVDGSGPPTPLGAGAGGVDRYKCYRIKSSKGVAKIVKGTTVELSDEFDEPASFAVRKPSRLCFPADVASAGVENPDGHLMCYSVQRTAGEHERRSGLHTDNAFEAANPDGPGVLSTTKESELCVPALVGTPPVPVCGDGAINQPTEQCDSPDDLACPGLLCQDDCTCAEAGVCGNGLAEPPSEQCDGGDDSACPGECTSICACLGARTFTLDPALSEAKTSLGVNVPLSGAVDFVVTQEIEPGVFSFDIPIVQLPGIDLGGLFGTICPFLVQDPALPPGIAGRGVLNCSGADLTGSGFLESPVLTNFQDHCVEGAAAGFCDSAPNPGGGKVHPASGVFVPDGTVDPTCSLPGDVIDDNPTHGGNCNGGPVLTEGAAPYASGDATLSLYVILDRRPSPNACAPPPTPGSAPVKISFTTGHEEGGIMDLSSNSASVYAFQLDGAAFDCTEFLLGDNPTGASIVGVFTALDAPILPGLELDIVSSIRFTGMEP